MTDRKILWWRYSSREGTEPDTGERHFWNILIINQEREHEQILQKLYEQFTPPFPMEKDSLHSIINETVIDSGRITKSCLHYWLHNFETTVPRIDFSEVYLGEVRKDRRLSPRKTPEGWYDLIDRVCEGNV